MCFTYNEKKVDYTCFEKYSFFKKLKNLKHLRFSNG